MLHTAQRGRMLCAPRLWPEPGGPRVLVTMGILTVVLWNCSGQRVSPPWDSPTISNQEHQRGLVFIHTGSSLYSLPCSPAEMEVANVTYHWVQDMAVPKLFSVTREGHLLFRDFQASYSGMYSCTISYMKQGVPVSQTFHYSIFGYHVLGGLDILLLFHSKLCEDKLTRWFIRSLHDKLMLLKIEQHFKLQTINTFCFPPPHTSSDEFIFQVQLEVSLFGPHWDEDCNPQDTATLTDCYHTTVQHNIEQVKVTLTRFFKEHKSFHLTGADVPSVSLTNEFVGIIKTQQCSRGYGQTKQLQSCLDCCVVCPPGTFSPPKDSRCLPCPLGTFSLIYGVTSCTPCRSGMITRAPGASSSRDCVKEERPMHGTQITCY